MDYFAHVYKEREKDEELKRESLRATIDYAKTARKALVISVVSLIVAIVALVRTF